MHEHKWQILLLKQYCVKYTYYFNVKMEYLKKIIIKK